MGRSGQRSARRHLRAGQSLVEVIVTVAVIGLLATVALVMYSGPVESSRAVIAGNNAESLNAAVWKYDQIVRTVPVAADNASTDDEAAVIALLQTRDAVLMPGSPYLSPGLTFATSDSEDEFRIRWNGTVFEVLDLGVEGEGLAF